MTGGAPRWSPRGATPGGQRARGALAVVCLLSVACAGPIDQRGPARLVADRPEYTVGDRWIRSDGIFDVVRVDASGVLFSSGAGDEIVLSRDLAPLRIQHQDRRVFEFDTPPAIPWPLRLGDRGSVRGWMVTAFGESIESDLGWEVDREELITVPAGSFRAMRLAFTVQAGRGGSNFGRGSYRPDPHASVYIGFWYAPDVRRIVKVESTLWQANAELVAVDPDAADPVRITLQSPLPDTDVAPDEGIRVVGTITAGRGVGAVAISLNGQELHRAEDARRRRKVILLDHPLELRHGRNVLLVTAADVTGASAQEARVITYTERLVVDLSPGRSDVQAARRHVLLKAPLAAADWLSASGASWAWVRVNDREFVATPAEATGSTLDIHATLNVGRNQVVITLYDAKLNKHVREWIVTVDPSLEGGASASARPPLTGGAVPGRPGTSARPQGSGMTSGPSPETSARLPSARPLDPPQTIPPVAPVHHPLRIELAAPPEQSRFQEEHATVAGIVAGGEGARTVVVTLNGAEVDRRQAGEPGASIPVAVPLTLREGQNVVAVTATDAAGRTEQEVRTVHFERAVPLTITLRFPEEQARLATESTVVAALVASGKGVSRVTVTVNGREVHQQVERSPQRSILVAVPITLVEGTNTVAITAAEPDGTAREERRTISYQRPVVTAAPAPPAAPPRPAARHWAVIVGAGDYEHPTIPKLRFTTRDAEAMYEVLTGPGGFRTERVLLLTDRTERKPTLRNLKWALGTFLARSARKEDTVVIFFAGHGAPEVDQTGAERDGLAKYLIPTDADPDDLYSTALPMDELQTVFNRIEAERVIVFLDACYSGAAGGRTFSSRRTRAVSVDDLFLERLARSRGRAIITASRPAEVSIELAELGHGLFTYYLVQGLRGAGDLNRDGIVSLQELYEYLEHHVTQRSRAVGGNQHPVMKGELEGALPLVKVGR